MRPANTGWSPSLSWSRSWPEARLIVEVGGYGAHGGREAFEADRARDLKLKLLGYEVARFTWRQLIDGPAEVAAALRNLLRANR